MGVGGLRGLPRSFNSMSVARTTTLLFFFLHAENGRRPHVCQNSASATPNCPSFWQLLEPTPAVTRSLYLMINTYNNAAARLTCTLGHLQLWSTLYFPSLFLLIVQEGGQEKAGGMRHLRRCHGDDRHLLHVDSAPFLPRPEANSNVDDDEQKE